ncbi:hypothetical protein OS493_034653 [Desmophyllum pertusum]|uniref:G-protein coupled receptors family 1 profile domain-containing protein n=1 Tax=Desmophyllum pertusum TaxID=174260 RepID=A0A9W9ZIU5_9CNID|nr:hypothetical protein OS493_034653 [Desmophyllum pertusum]
MRQLKIAQMERKFATTSFFILLFLILSLVPYFVAIIIEANCLVCRGQKWLFVLKESSVIFLFLNSTVNPLLTTFRINGLKHSVKIVLRLRRQSDVNSFGSFLPPTSLANVVCN